MYCRQCGKEVAPGARFCAGCGAAVGKATPRLALPSGIDRKIWLVLCAVAGVVFLVVSGTLVVDSWRKKPSTNVVPKTAEDLRAVDLASLVYQSNDLPLDTLGLIVIEQLRWAATAEDVRSLAHQVGKDILNNFKVMFAKPSKSNVSLGQVLVVLYANVLSAQNSYQKIYDLARKIRKKEEVHEVSDAGERAFTVIVNDESTFVFLRCHAFATLSSIQPPVSPADALAYGKRLDERLRIAACP
ncbi:MAG: zinc-ribbon domain-containing protein [Gammaproteobacteria bacterium]